MSAIYTITKLPDPRWDAFVDECHQKGMVYKTGDRMVNELEEYMRAYRGKMLIDNNRGSRWWLSSIEFESEEDLIVFKLKFN